MRKTLATLAWAAIPALLLSACNGTATGGSSGITPTSNTPIVSQRSRVHHNDVSANDLHGGGATFPAYGYNLGDQPTGLYTSAQPTAGPGSLLYNVAQKNNDGNNYYYCLTGSGYGKNEFDDNSEQTGADACAALGQTHTGFGGRTDPVDWIGSDIGLASNECCASGSYYYSSPYYGNGSGQYGTAPLEIPTYGGPLVFPYINCSSCGPSGNPAGLLGLGNNQLKLSTWSYCAIANGTIGYWDDAAITADNGGTAVSSHQPITFVYRSDASGTTYLFESKLNDSKEGCNQTWKGKYAKRPYERVDRVANWSYGVPSPSNALWNGPNGAQPSGSNFEGESGNPGVIEAIQGLLGTGFPYATGYAEGAWANAASSPSIQQAAVLSGVTFVSPTNPNAVAEALAKATASKINYGMGSDGNPLGSSNAKCQLFIPPTAFLDPPAGAYPIVGLSYFLFYGQNQTRLGSNHYTDLAALIQYIDSKAWNNALPSLEYTPLPASTQKKVQQAAFGKGAHHKGACFNA